jgi:predicted flap endonuclease-1-like 5' DNA nuclease
MTAQTIIVVLVALLVGFLIGWLTEWALDLLRWRARAKWAGFDLEEAQIGKEGVVQFGTGEGGDYGRIITGYLEKRDAEIHDLQAKAEAKEAQLDALQARFDKYVQTHPDDLTAIKGIGRIYQWKLRDGGINSYTELAQTTPERLKEILDVPAWRRIEPESWTEQAKALARQG